MRKENILLGTVVVLLLGALIWDPTTGNFFQNLITNRLLPTVSPSDTLLIENASLKTKIALLESVSEAIGEAPSDAISAFVFSRYPFSFRNEFLINVGAEQGISQGDGVLYHSFLVGKVERVFLNESLFRTIFDPRWQSVVRVGNGGYEALFVGGNIPTLTLIDKDASIEISDVIYSADQNFLYGVPLGEVRSVQISSDYLFQEATIKLPYVLSDMRDVSVVISKSIPQ